MDAGWNGLEGIENDGVSFLVMANVVYDHVLLCNTTASLLALEGRMVVYTKLWMPKTDGIVHILDTFRLHMIE